MEESSDPPPRKPYKHKFKPKIPPPKPRRAAGTNTEPPHQGHEVSDGDLDRKPGDADTAAASSKKAKVQPGAPHDPIIEVPLERPFAGENSDDDEAYEEDLPSEDQDENRKTAAEELGLLPLQEQSHVVEKLGEEMFFFQFPACLPFEKQAADATKGKEEIVGCSLQDLPAGFMGKILVYKSGIVKMKLGETMFDVSVGTQRNLSRVVAAINTKEKHYCKIGEIGADRNAVVTPDLDSLLDSDPQDSSI